MEKITKMVEEITLKRKMTKSVKYGLDNRIFLNYLVAGCIMLYICAIEFSYNYVPNNIKEILFKIFPMVLILITVVVFEIAYKKDSGKITITGIELMFFSVYTLYVPKIFENSDKLFCRVLLLMPIYCAIYYVIKSILIYKKTEKNYQNNLSDVKEIVKEDE